MRSIALIDDPTELRRIVEHLGRWAPEAAEASMKEFAVRTKAAWAWLIRKVYERDTLDCPLRPIAEIQTETLPKAPDH